jgi:hypothetical protein
MTQAWYTSRTIWVLGLGLIFNVLVMLGVVPVDMNTTGIIDGILSVLAIVFRWQATGPLTK